MQNVSNSGLDPFNLNDDVLLSFTLVGTKGDPGLQGLPGQLELRTRWS